jgi:uncharacterized protein YdhG (YjbR/CyaY superfamily)
MKSNALTIKQYIDSIPEDRKKVINRLIDVISHNIPKGFSKVISYGYPGFVIPHLLYPDGYHCDTKLPLPFISVASQKHFVAVYHCGLYANSKLMNWFLSEYPKYSNRKLDMGKGCIRFKKIEEIPYKLIGELSSKMTTKDWISIYEKNIKR